MNCSMQLIIRGLSPILYERNEKTRVVYVWASRLVETDKWSQIIIKLPYAHCYSSLLRINNCYNLFYNTARWSADTSYEAFQFGRNIDRFQCMPLYCFLHLYGNTAPDHLKAHITSDWRTVPGGQIFNYEGQVKRRFYKEAYGTNKLLTNDPDFGLAS